LVTSCVGTVFYKTLLKEVRKKDSSKGKTRKKTQAATG